MRNKVKIAIGAGMASVMALSVVPEPAFADPVSDETAFVQKLNDLRWSRGLRPLAANGGLTNMARGWSSHMAAVGRISHNPNMAAQAPGNWARLGENVGVGPSVDSLHHAFAASPGHFANMVNAHYDSVGVGVVHSGGSIYVTFNFMATQAAAPAAALPVVRSAAPAAPAPSRTVCRRSRRGRVICRRAKVRRATKARGGRSSRARARRR